MTDPRPDPLEDTPNEQGETPQRRKPDSRLAEAPAKPATGGEGAAGAGGPDGFGTGT
jgi:hypothetical protein